MWVWNGESVPIYPCLLDTGLPRDFKFFPTLEFGRRCMSLFSVATWSY